jgi:hypothetical protein
VNLAERPDIAVAAGRCPFCGNAALHSFTAVAYDVPGARVALSECPACRLAWQSALKSLDSDALMQQCHEEAAGFWSADEVSGRIRRQAEFVLTLMPPGRLLDVGGADGAFATAVAERGWDCTVIDPAFPPARLSPRVNILRGLTGDLPLDPVYDVATMWAMIEHVNDFASMMHDVQTRLRPGGKLIIEALNYQSINRLRGGDRWWGYQLDHQWYLSPEAYGRYLQQAGFRHWEVVPTVLRDNWSGPSSVPGAFGLLRRCARRPQHIPATLRSFFAERRACRLWPRWYGFGLTLIVATK